ncbi:Protein suppressor of hairy wing, partial [Gryllus bimaculatus]
MEFNTTSEQKAHERKHDESYSCQMCNKKFSSEYLYEKHLNEHIFQEKPNECKKCGRRFKNEVALNIHKKRHVNIACTTCNMHFLNDTDLLLHIKEHCDDDVMTLLKNIAVLDEEESQLEEMLSLYSKLTLEAKLNDLKNVENDTCENSVLDCVNTMISTVSQFTDIDIPSKKGSECRLCGMKVSSDKELLDHRKQFHLRNRTCPFCGKRSRSVSQTWRHMHSHILKNKNSISKQPIATEKEITTNSGDRNEGCEVLSSAKAKQSRKNTRLYSCNICSRKFLYPGSRD